MLEGIPLRDGLSFIKWLGAKLWDGVTFFLLAEKLLVELPPSKSQPGGSSKVGVKPWFGSMLDISPS